MKKFLNFSTILFSYLLITVLVISCGGSSGGGGGTGGSSVGDATNGNGGNGGDATDNTDGSDGNGGEPNDATNGSDGNGGEPTDATNGSDGNGGDPNDATNGSDGNGGDPNDATDSTDGGNPPQVELNDACFLENRQGEATLAAILCYEGELFATITKDTTEIQQLNLLIDSVDNPGGTPSRTWDLSTARQIHISYDKDYTLTVDVNTLGDIGTIAETTDHTAEFPLQNLTIASLLNDNKDALRSGVINFMPTSGRAIKVYIGAKLAVKSQADFISMANVSIPEFTSETYQLPYVLVNDLDLVAPGGEGAKFDSSIIPVAETAFLFDGGGKTINLNSEIDAVANDKPAAIIGETKRAVSLQNFTLNVNQPISGTEYVSTIIANASSGGLIENIKININGSLSLYKPNVYSTAGNQAYVGGVVGKSCADINNVAVKTVTDAVIQAHVADDMSEDAHYFVGGLVAVVDCPVTSDVVTNNNLVDVTLGSFARAGNKGNTLLDNRHWIGGLISEVRAKVIMDNNLVRLSISSDNNLSADFFAWGVAGLVRKAEFLQSAANNLVYVDFSNLDKYKYAAGLFYELNNLAAANNIANNMVFIADGFDSENIFFNNIPPYFGAAIGSVGSEGAVANLTDSFFSSPIFISSIFHVNGFISAFVADVQNDMNFKNLIVDYKSGAGMFNTGSARSTVVAKIDTANIFSLAESKTNQVSTIFPENNASWEEGSQNYPQLKVPTTFVGSVTKAEIEAAWTKTNEDIQTRLPAREASQK